MHYLSCKCNFYKPLRPVKQQYMVTVVVCRMRTALWKSYKLNSHILVLKLMDTPDKVR